MIWNKSSTLVSLHPWSFNTLPLSKHQHSVKSAGNPSRDPRKLRLTGVKSRDYKYGIMSKAAIDLTFDLHRQAIANLFFFPYCRISNVPSSNWCSIYSLSYPENECDVTDEYTQGYTLKTRSFMRPSWDSFWNVWENTQITRAITSALHWRDNVCMSVHPHLFQPYDE